MSNFSFVRAEWGFLHEAAHKAEQAVCNDPRTACFYARHIDISVGLAEFVYPCRSVALRQPRRKKGLNGAFGAGLVKRGAQLDGFGPH